MRLVLPLKYLKNLQHSQLDQVAQNYPFEFGIQRLPNTSSALRAVFLSFFQGWIVSRIFYLFFTHPTYLGDPGGVIWYLTTK